MEQQKLKNIIEAVLMSAEKPLKVNELENLFVGDNDMPTRDEIRAVLQQLGEDFETRGFELKQVASGYRIQVRQDYADWVGRLWEEKPARYSRALLETIALIAYRQPITRGEIEEVRGVSVSSNIIKTLMEREWIKVLGHKDVPGKPALYGTTKEFLDYFNLQSLDELPTLAEIRSLDQIHPELDLDVDNTDAAADLDGAESAHGESASDGAAGEPGAAHADDDSVNPIEVPAESPAAENASASAEADEADDVTELNAGNESRSEEQTAGADDAGTETKAGHDGRLKAVATAVEEVEAEADFAEAEPQTAAS